MSQIPTRRKRRRRRKRSWSRTILLLIVVFAALAAVYRLLVHKPQLPSENPAASSAQSAADSAAVSAGASVDPQPDRFTRKDDFFTILVSGMDDDNGGSDTNILVAFDAGGQAVHCVSIPRDSGVYYKGKAQKVNVPSKSGVRTLADTLASTLGIPVDFTVQVDLRGFVRLVDAIDGVDFEIPENMNYDDPTQDLHIHIPEGSQKLTGEQFVQLMRFRSGYAGGDIQRIDMQHELLMAVATQMLSLKNIPNLSEVISIVTDNMKTSLSTEDMLYYAKEFLKLDKDNIKFMTMPGDTNGSVFGSSYVFCDIDAWLDMVNEYLNPWETDVTCNNVDIVTYKNGNFYSTTGELKGGVSSFLNYSSSSAMGLATVYPYTGSTTSNTDSKDDNR